MNVEEIKILRSIAESHISLLLSKLSEQTSVHIPDVKITPDMSQGKQIFITHIKMIII